MYIFNTKLFNELVTKQYEEGNKYKDIFEGIGLVEGHLQRLKSGNIKCPDINVTKKIANYFERPIDDFIIFEIEQTKFLKQ